MVDHVLPATWRLRRAMRQERTRPSAQSSDVLGPVVVGGVGGSGTRVVEEMLRRLGVYTGPDLNSAGDNRWFTLLCKLPRWDVRDLGPDNEVARALGTLERAMTGRLDVAGPDGSIIEEAFRRSCHWWRGDRLRDDRPPRWLRARVGTLLRSSADAHASAPLWGWKEPNSHLMIQQLGLHFGKRLRYVHVIRNGLDMTQSRNQLQIRRWGSIFGLDGIGERPTPADSLDYWIRANETAIESGEALRPGSFLLLNYDEMCGHPEREIARFAKFLDLDPHDEVLRDLVSIPRHAAATPRAPRDVEQVFGRERVARVASLGFPVLHSQGRGPI